MKGRIYLLIILILSLSQCIKSRNNPYDPDGENYNPTGINQGRTNITTVSNIVNTTNGSTMIIFQKEVYPGTGFIEVYDTQLYKLGPTNNYGKYFQISANSTTTDTYVPSLIKFDIKNYISDDAEIVKAYLQLYYIASTWNNKKEIGLYKVTHYWTEGTNTSGGKAVNGASWNTYNGTNNWSEPGGNYENSPIATSVLSNNVNSWITWDLPASLVQEWINTPEQNYGLYLKYTSVSEQNAKAFASSDNSTIYHRPKLVVYFKFK